MQQPKRRLGHAPSKLCKCLRTSPLTNSGCRDRALITMACGPPPGYTNRGYRVPDVEQTRLARSRHAGIAHGEGRARCVRGEEPGGSQGAHATGIIGPASGTPQGVAEAILPRARKGSGALFRRDANSPRPRYHGGKQLGGGRSLGVVGPRETEPARCSIATTS